MKRALAYLALAALFPGCGGGDQAQNYDWTLPPGVEPPLAPEDNPQSDEKVELGRHLFYDLRLSLNGDRACATCHEQAKGFTDGFHRAVGTTNELHGHNTSSLANVGYRTRLGWSTNDEQPLERQLLTPLLGDDPVEMGMGALENELLAALAADPFYEQSFAEAFPQEPEPVTLPNLARAIASFERTIISRDAPLDRYLRGDDAAISAEAIRGWELFSGELACIRCHGGDDFASPTDETDLPVSEAGYFNIGLYDLDPNDSGAYPETAQGLFEVTGIASDMGRFRTPTLRNLAYTGPYMHDGSVLSVEQAVDIMLGGGRLVESGPFAGDGRGNIHKSELLIPVELSADDRAALLAMLDALNDPTLIERSTLASPFE